MFATENLPLIVLRYRQVNLTCFHLAMLALMATRAVVTFRTGGTSHLLQVLFRDGSMYYIWILGLAMLNVVIMASLPDDYLPLLVFIHQAVHSVLSCRIILQLREQRKSKTRWQDNI
ncbi:hypothetical protein D9756_010346 [Leucocoprinus leucothites]|uniref:Uncharacterized protein n=1 Tax=Leucocoprinus leucothites TaxID=201217 RepID=A0A8H5CU59_9AGAR|nr:hypothetical protein D9756_010346 [Leucoagaricus leucothites]